MIDEYIDIEHIHSCIHYVVTVKDIIVYKNKWHGVVYRKHGGMHKSFWYQKIYKNLMLKSADGALYGVNFYNLKVTVYLKL